MSADGCCFVRSQCSSPSQRQQLTCCPAGPAATAKPTPAEFSTALYRLQPCQPSAGVATRRVVLCKALLGLGHCYCFDRSVRLARHPVVRLPRPACCDKVWRYVLLHNQHRLAAIAAVCCVCSLHAQGVDEERESLSLSWLRVLPMDICLAAAAEAFM